MGEFQEGISPDLSHSSGIQDKFLVDGQSIIVNQGHLHNLGKKIEFTNLKPSVGSRLQEMDKASLEAHGLPLLDYLFIAHHYLGKSLRQLDQEFGQGANTTSGIFRRFQLPALSREESYQRIDHSERVRNMWANKSAEERTMIAKKREESKTQEEKDRTSDAIRRAWERRNPNRDNQIREPLTAEERSEIARRQWANRTPEERRRIGLKAALTKYGVREPKRRKTSEERSEIAKTTNANRTEEERREIGQKISRAKREYWLNMTPEERSARARQRSDNMTPEERSEAARKANAVRSLEQKQESARKRSASFASKDRSVIARKGWEGKSPEEIERRILNIQKAFLESKYYYEGNYFQSLSEATTGVMLEKYIPNFKLKAGDNFQIYIGLRKTADFKIEDVFVEYHPLLVFHSGEKNIGAFKSWEEYSSFRTVLSLLATKEERDEYVARMRKVLADEYYSERKRIIDLNPSYKGSELVLVQSPEELYDFVITRFGKDYPGREQFMLEFKQIYQAVKKENKDNKREEVAS